MIALPRLRSFDPFCMAVWMCLITLPATGTGTVRTGFIPDTTGTGSGDVPFDTSLVIGTTAPQGGTFTDSIAPSPTNDAGQTAFFATLSSGQEGVWVYDNGQVSELARSGDPALGAPLGVEYDTFDFFRQPPGINNSGQVSFRAFLTNTLGPTDNATGVWTGDHTALRLVALGGEPAPETEPGTLLSNNGTYMAPVINDANETTFRSYLLQGGNIAFEKNEAVWIDTAGQLRLVVQDGTPAPGTGPGVTFGNIEGTGFSFYDPDFNNAGEVRFHASLKGSGVDYSNDEGIWVRRGDQVELWVRTGATLQGSDPDVHLGSGSNPVFPSFMDITENNLERSVIHAYLTRTDGSFMDPDGSGLVYRTPDGALELLARDGDFIDVDPDPLTQDLREISWFSFNPGTLTDEGSLRIRIFFTDNTSGVFLANVPEPSSVTLVGLAVLLSARHFGRRGISPSSCRRSCLASQSPA